jgi:hypothetical protein
VDTWDLLKELYKASYGVSGIVVEYIAVYDILKSCAEGKSNSTIALSLDFDKDYIKATTKEFFNFDGLIIDIGFNTRHLYAKYKDNQCGYLTMCKVLDDLIAEDIYKNLWVANVLLDKIESEIENYYASA